MNVGRNFPTCSIFGRRKQAAVTVGKTSTALGAFYRRLAAHIGKAKAVTATARRIAVLFYNTMRFGTQYVGPGADHYEQRYKERVIKQLHRRAPVAANRVDIVFELSSQSMSQQSTTKPPPDRRAIDNVRHIRELVTER